MPRTSRRTSRSRSSRRAGLPLVLALMLLAAAAGWFGATRGQAMLPSAIGGGAQQLVGSRPAAPRPPENVGARRPAAAQPPATSGNDRSKAPARDTLVPAARPVAAIRPLVDARPMPVCGSGRRVNCVVDGDTLWVNGEKIRLQGIDAPEVRGACRSETALAARATRRLSELVSGRDLAIVRSGKDRHGRTLAVIEAVGRDVGDKLIDEGLAQPWKGRKARWCDA